MLRVLVEEGFLGITADGAFVARPELRRRLKAAMPVSRLGRIA